MRLALIQCPVWGTYDPPVGLAQLSGCLKKAGCAVSVFDLNIKLYRNRSENYKNIWAWEQSSFWYDQECVDKFFGQNKALIDKYIKEITATGPKVAGFSVNAASRLASLKIAGMIKQIDKNIIVVFGGPLFFEEKFVNHILEEDAVDVVIRQEGEFVFTDLARLIDRRMDIVSCPGIYFKDAGRIIHTGPREPIADLDTLPFMDFTDLPLADYDDRRHVPFMASRGCIQRCVFCSSRAFSAGYRAMSGERVFKEIESLKKRLGKINPELAHVDFLDLMFNGNMKHLVAFCDLLIKSRLKIFWTANMIIRPEMSPEVIKKMADSGCEHVIFGIESGSQRVLDLMRKAYRVEDADRIIRCMHQAGITVTANFMFGFPGEREEDFQKTLDFIKRNHAYLSRVYPSRTYCAIEEFSYLSGHLEEFDIRSNPPNHLYWESVDGKNTYPERLKRCEEFCNLVSSLGVEVGSGVQTSVELDRWFNLGAYYECKGDFQKAVECFLKYRQLDPKNEAILNKIMRYSGQKQSKEKEKIGV
ncbi:MAG: radical SAM protein [Candidatus Omnitrophica bacterium]|nr:radical SAM protein [Candidatus Omnitrophota bacterium]